MAFESIRSELSGKWCQRECIEAPVISRLHYSKRINLLPDDAAFSFKSSLGVNYECVLTVTEELLHIRCCEERFGVLALATQPRFYTI